MDTIRQAAEWDACAEAYWSAACELAGSAPELVLPRLRLAGLALDYRLRTFVCAVRGGTPEGGDLDRLLRLASFCGLDLEPAQREVVQRLGPVHQGDPDIRGAPSVEAVGAVLASITAQCRQPIRTSQ